MAVNGGNINFQVNMSVGKSDLSSLIKPLQQIQAQANGIKLDGAQNQLLKAADAAKQLESILNQSWNSKLGQLNLSSFNQGITSAFTNVEGLRNALNSGGDVGRQAFNNLAHTVLNTNVQLKESNTLLDQMATSMANTVKWGITSSIFKTITGSIQQAFNYTKNLDTSLTNIRIVTGASADEMDRFAVAANKSAQELGRSTLEYTKAATSYYQQGLSDEDVKARTEITMKAQNITGAGVEMVDYLTSVWNGFKVTTDEAESYVDKLAKVADSSASDMSQLATAMSKVAATANIMGVDVDQLSAQLATVIATTRQAPEAVGTAFKTIFTRLNDIKTGAEDAEISLGKYSGAMASLGFNVLDANGQLRDTGQVMEQIGSRWGELTKAQQVYLASTMGGQRQITQLIALFDNWTRYSDLLNVSLSAQGTLDEKNSRYLDSMAAHMQKLTTQAQRTYDVLFDTKVINGFTDIFRGALNLFNDYISGLGGGTRAFIDFGAVVANVFNKQIAQGIQNAENSFQRFKNNKNLQKMPGQIVDSVLAQTRRQNLTTGINIDDSALRKQAEAAQKTYAVQQGLTEQQRKQAIQIQSQIGLSQQKINNLQKQQQIANETVKTLQQEEIIKGKSIALLQNEREHLQYSYDVNQKSLITMEAMENSFSKISSGTLSYQQHLSTQLNLLDQINLESDNLRDVWIATGYAEQDFDKNLKIIQEGIKNSNTQTQEFKNAWDAIKNVTKQYSNNQQADLAKIDTYLKNIGIDTTKLTEEEKARLAILLQENNAIAQQGKHTLNLQKHIRQISGGIQIANAFLGGMSQLFKEGATGAEKINGIFTSITGSIAGIANIVAPGSGFLVQGLASVVKTGLELVGVWDIFSEKLESDQEKISRLQESYRNAFNQQNQTNKNISNLKSIKEQWDELSNKVGAYGQNINLLTQDEKSRYYQLIDTFSQYNENVILGYTAQGEAIIANNGELDQTIEKLQQIKRENVQKTLGDISSVLKDADSESAKGTRYRNQQVKKFTAEKGLPEASQMIQSTKTLLGNIQEEGTFNPNNIDLSAFSQELTKNFKGNPWDWLQDLQTALVVDPETISLEDIEKLKTLQDKAIQILNSQSDQKYQLTDFIHIEDWENIRNQILTDFKQFNGVLEQLDREAAENNKINSGLLMTIMQNYDKTDYYKAWDNLKKSSAENETLFKTMLIKFMDSFTFDPQAVESDLQTKTVKSNEDLLNFAADYAKDLTTQFNQMNNIIQSALKESGSEQIFDAQSVTGTVEERISTIKTKINQILSKVSLEEYKSWTDNQKIAFKELMAQTIGLDTGDIKFTVLNGKIIWDDKNFRENTQKQIKTHLTDLASSFENSEDLVIDISGVKINLEALSEIFNPQQISNNIDFENAFKTFLFDKIQNGLKKGAKGLNFDSIKEVYNQALAYTQNVDESQINLNFEEDTNKIIDKLEKVQQLKEEQQEYLNVLEQESPVLKQIANEQGRNSQNYRKLLKQEISLKQQQTKQQIDGIIAEKEALLERNQAILDNPESTEEQKAAAEKIIATTQADLNRLRYEGAVLEQNAIDRADESVKLAKEQLKLSEQQYKQQQKLSQSGKELSKNLQKEDYALTESDYELIGQYAAKYKEVGQTLKQFGPYSQEFANALSNAVKEEEKLTEESKKVLLAELERQKAAYIIEEREAIAARDKEAARAAAEKRVELEAQIAKMIAEANGQLEKTLGLKEAIAQADKNERDNQTEQAERDRDEALDRMEALEDAETTSRKLQKREQDNSLSKEDFYNMQAFEAAHPQMQGQFGTDDYTSEFAKWAKNTYNIISAQDQVKEQAIAANQILIDNTEKSLKEIEDQLINKEDYEAARKRLQAQQILNNEEASNREKGFATQTLDHYGYGRDKDYTQKQQDQDLQLINQYNDQESLRDQRTSLLEQKKQAEYTQNEIASKQTVSTRDADVTADDVVDKMELLQNKAEEFNLSDELLEDKQALEDLAEEIARYDSAMERATKSAKEWKEALENGTATSETVDELKNAYADLLGVAEDSLPEAFVKSAENAQLLEDEVNQIEGAYQQLQNNYRKELLIEMGLDESSAEAVVDEVNSLIDQYHIDDIEVGASLDGTDFSNALAQILSNTYSTVDAAQAALLGLGFNGTVTEDTTTGEETNEFPQSQVTLEDNTMDYVVPQLTAGPIPGDTMGQTMAQLTGAPQTATMHIPEVHTKVNPVPEETTKEQKSMAFKIEGLSRSSGGDIKHKATSHKSPSGGGRGGGGCFIAGTLVSVLDGYKNIEDIKKGDIVLSYNTQFNRVECSMVLETMIHNVAESIYTLYIEDEQLVVTGIHKFLITRNAQKDWIQASDLRKGDLVLFADGTWHEIYKISIHFRHTLVYNFEVLENHNYFVGKNQILAHNKGGGGGGSAKKAQKIDKPKNTADRYRGVNKKLKSASSDLKKLQDEHKKTFGKDSIKNLEKQLDIIKDQVKYTKQKLKLAQQEQKERQEELKKQGVKFFSNGQISNYKQVTDAAYKDYADFVEKYNKASGEWQEENKETLDELKKNYDKLVSDIGQYDALTQMMTGLNDDLENFANQEIQLKIDKLNLEVELKLNTQQAQRQFEDFRHRIMKRFSDSNLQERANLDTRQIDSYLKENGTIDTQRRYLDKLLRQRQKMETTGKAPTYGTDRKQLEDDIKQASENLQNSLEEVYSYYEDLDDIQMEYLEHTKDLFDAQNQLYDAVDSELSHELALVQLMYGDDAYYRMNNLYTKQLENSQAQIDALKTQRDYYQQMMMQEQENLNKSGYKKGTVQYDKAIERIEAYKQEWLNTTQQVNAAVENAVQLSIQKYQNSINKTFADLEKQLTGGKSLDYIGEEWQLMKKQSDMYLDNVNAIYQTDKLENAFRQAIKDNTGNLKVQKQLNEAMQTQLSYLREKEKLTQYDIDRANKLLDIEVKRAALEQASQSKTQLRLRRDSQGNYSYQYAANQNDIANAAQQLEDARNDLYNFTKEAYQKNLDDYYSTFAEMQEKLKAVYNDTTLSAKERQQKIAMYQQYYGQMMYDYTWQNEQKKQDLTITSLQNLAYAWDKHNADLTANEDALTVNYSNNQAQRRQATAALIQDVQDAQIDNNAKLGLLYDESKDKYVENQDSKKNRTESLTGETDELWGKSVTELQARYGTDVTNFQSHLNDMATGVKGLTDKNQTGSMPALFETAFAGLDTLETNAETDWQDMIDTNVAALSGQGGDSSKPGLIPAFNSGVQEMADKFTESINEMEDTIDPEDKNSGIGHRFGNVFDTMEGHSNILAGAIDDCDQSVKTFKNDVENIESVYGKKIENIGTTSNTTATKIGKIVTQTGILSGIVDGFSTTNIVTQLGNEKQALDDVVTAMKEYQKAHSSIINKANTSITNAQVKQDTAESKTSGQKSKTKKTATADDIAGIAAVIVTDLGSGKHGGWNNVGGDRSDSIKAKFENNYNGLELTKVIASLVSYTQGRAEWDRFGMSESLMKDLDKKVKNLRSKYSKNELISKYGFSSYDTGGYTGAWGKSGRLAMLHEKELVLNKEDTKNILNAVQVNRKIADLMNNINNNNLASQLLSKFNERTEKLDQNVTITATFPNVSSSIEIEKAFDNLTNRASQYALRR